jgi:CheY-like chemotaxis protein
MVFGFVSRSAGVIDLVSEVGMGTTFSIYLPRAKHTQLRARKTERLDEIVSDGHETILVVDDEASLLELAVDALSLRGYTVLTATDAGRALDILAREEHIDLLLTDVVMPGEMNGIELAEKVRMLYPGLPIILSSGYTDMGMTKDIDADLKSQMLVKPYTHSQLISAIQAGLGQAVGTRRDAAGASA